MSFSNCRLKMPELEGNGHFQIFTATFRAMRGSPTVDRLDSVLTRLGHSAFVAGTPLFAPKRTFSDTYSTASSARASSDRGKVRPSPFRFSD